MPARIASCSSPRNEEWLPAALALRDAGLDTAATGATARRRAVTTAVQLIAQEAQIARLAADGLSSPEIGARLYLSPRTVQYHLGKVFTKLGITSRAQLGRALSGS